MESKRVSRDELYGLVWTTPMSRLASEFGITGNGLAKICDRLDVPYPPRGYWAKKVAGKPVVTFKLPARPDDVPGWVDIQPTPPREEASPAVRAAVEAAAATVRRIAVPESLEGLHPKIRGWIAEHRREQKEREQENRRQRRDPWAWTRPLLDDLTVRDLYRFRVTSAIFSAVEHAGGKIEDAPITGKVTFRIGRHQVACSIVERMVKPLKLPRGDDAKWTAYPDHHQSGLHSSGFLRVTITTYLGCGRQPPWVETENKKIADWLPEIVGRIISAGPILAEQQQQREDRERRYREEAARCYEQQRLKEVDDRRWARFQQGAASWDERSRLLSFLAELERRLEAEGEGEIGDGQFSEWIAWARGRIEELDPFAQGLPGFFGFVSSSS